MGVLPKTDKLADVFLDLLDRARSGACTSRATRSCTSSRRPAASGRSRRSSTPTSTRTRCRTRTSTSRSSSPTRSDQSDRQLARQALVEGDAYVTMTYWLQQNLEPVRPRGGLRGQQRSGRPAGASRRSRRSSRRRSSSRPSRAPSGRSGSDRRRLRRDQRGVRRPARVDRADPPPREVRQPTRRRSTSSCRPTSPPGWARAGRSGSRTRSASTSCGVWLRRDPERRRADAAARGAAGWGGDRVALLDGPNGSGPSS